MNSFKSIDKYNALTCKNQLKRIWKEPLNSFLENLNSVHKNAELNISFQLYVPWVGKNKKNAFQKNHRIVY